MGRALLIINTEADRQKASHWIGKAPWGARITFQAAKRTVDQNSLMWAALTDVAQQVEHLGQRYTPEAWKILFMHACGREVRFLPGLDGKTFVPWGQSSSDLSKQEMTDLIEFIFSWGAEHGVSFNNENPSDVDAPSSDGQGSDGSQAIPGKPQAVAADNSLSQESGTTDGGIEAPAEPDALPSVDLNRSAKLRECIDKFITAASDPTIHDAKDRQQTVIFAKDAWKASLPNDAAFVKVCTDTANKVVKGELKADAARRYLEGLLS